MTLYTGGDLSRELFNRLGPPMAALIVVAAACLAVGFAVRAFLK